MSVLAYHLTWTTYGTWLPGDARGWIKDGVWSVQEPDPEREAWARSAMVETAVWLTPDQRLLVEQTIRDHCAIRDWVLHALNARTNHVHVVVTASLEWKEVRDQLKAWCSRRLSDQAGLKAPVARKAGRRHWFTEGGDGEEIEDEAYLENAIRYVLEGQ